MCHVIVTCTCTLTIIGKLGNEDKKIQPHIIVPYLSENKPPPLFDYQVLTQVFFALFISSIL